MNDSLQWRRAKVAARGAECDQCALRVLLERHDCWGPVPGEGGLRPVIVVGERPTAKDAKEGRPFVGEEGHLVGDVLRAEGLDRSDVAWTFRVACPTYVSPSYTDRQVKKIIEENPDLLPPEQACAPRMEAEIGAPSYDRVLVAAGKLAFHGVFRARKDNVAKVHGALVEAEGRRVVPTVSPRFVLARGRWKEPFQHAVRQAIHWQRGKIKWVDPRMAGTNMKRPPSLKKIRRILERWQKQDLVVAYDVETTDIEALRCRLRMIQLSTATEGFAIPIRTKQGRTQTIVRDKQRGEVIIPPSEAEYYPYFYPPRTLRKILRLVRDYLRHPGKNTLVSVNGWIFDDLVLEVDGKRLIGKSMAPPKSIDLMAVQRIADCEAPRSLAYMGQQYSVVVDWKAGKGNGWDADTDRELAIYGVRDSTVTARAAEKLLPRLIAPDGGGPKGPALLHNDEEMARVCTGMKKLGYHVDQKKRAELEARFTKLAEENSRLVAAALHQGGYTQWVERVGPDQYDFRRDKKGKPYLNLNSTMQVRELFYTDWDLPPPKDLISPFDPEEGDFSEWVASGMRAKFLTTTGEPSTGDPIMRAYLAQHHTEGLLEPWQADVMRYLRKVRKAQKLISDKLVTTRLLDPSDYDRLGYPKVKKKGSKWPVTAVWADGVLRTGWKLGTGIGRLSSGDPFNLQNMAKVLRSMLVAAPGHVLVGADSDQIHLKIIANIWKIPSLVEDFSNGRDPHCTMAAMAFGDAWRRALTATGGNYKTGLPMRYRSWGKTIRFTGAYGGKPGAIHSVMQKADDENWNLTNLDVTLEEVEAFYDAWMAREPQWKTAWRRAIQRYEKQGYIAETWTGRRCYFKDGTQIATKAPNWEVLGEEAGVMTQATREVARQIPFGSWSAHTGVLEQCHDALVVQVPKDRAAEAARILENAMNIARWDRKIMYTAAADIGRSRIEVAC